MVELGMSIIDCLSWHRVGYQGIGAIPDATAVQVRISAAPVGF